MKIDLKLVKSLNPCKEILNWYKKHGTNDLFDTLLKLNEWNEYYIPLVFARLMCPKQRLEIAIFYDEIVLHIFKDNKGYKKAKKCVEAAKTYLNNPLEDNKRVAINFAKAVYSSGLVDHTADEILFQSGEYYPFVLSVPTPATNIISLAKKIDDSTRKQAQIDVIKRAVEILDRDNKGISDE